MRKRAELLGHIQLTKLQYNLPDFGKSIAYRRNRHLVKSHFSDPAVTLSMNANLSVIERLDEVISELEKEIERSAKRDKPNTLRILQSVPGIGPILALTILYEIESISRFPRVLICAARKVSEGVKGEVRWLWGKQDRQPLPQVGFLRSYDPLPSRCR